MPRKDRGEQHAHGHIGDQGSGARLQEPGDISVQQSAGTEGCGRDPDVAKRGLQTNQRCLPVAHDRHAGKQRRLQDLPREMQEEREQDEDHKDSEPGREGNMPCVF